MSDTYYPLEPLQPGERLRVTPQAPVDPGVGYGVPDALASDPAVAAYQANPQAEAPQALNRLLGAGGEERYQLWPERLLRSGFSLPGDVASGAVPAWDPATGHTSEEMMQRAQDTAGLAMTGGLAGTGERGMVVGSGPVRRAAMTPEELFRSKIGEHDFYHEAPGDVAESMRRKGIEGDYGVFATVGQPSGFVVTPKKTVVRFRIPKEELEHVGPDMRYDADAPHADLVRQHPEIKGADVTYPDNIPPHWIKDIQVLNAKNEAAAPLSALEKGPVWHSPVENAIAQSTTASAPAAQWLATIKNARGVKPEELDWLGLGDFLSARGAEKVSKSELESYVAAHKVQPQDVVKGGGPNEGQLQDMAQEQAYQELRRKYPHMDQESEEFQDLHQSFAIDKYEEMAKKLGTTKYHDYVLPGGENYREHLLTLPNQPLKALEDFRAQIQEKYTSQFPKLNPEEAERMRVLTEAATNQDPRRAGGYTSSHWDEPNILAHVRTNDRMMGDKRSLHIEEIQSDWHQAGRKKGYATDVEKLPIVQEIRALGIKYPWERISPRQIEEAGGSRELADRWAREMPSGNAVPDAPFKTSWPELALKRMIRRAAEEGYGRISWTPGEAQAARYDLSKHYERLVLTHNRDGVGELEMYPKGDGRVRNMPIRSEQELADAVGKDLAEKLYKQGRENNGKARLDNLDLKVGGEGMREFYDKMLPKMAEKVGKAHGVRVQRGEIEGLVPDKNNKYVNVKGKNPVHYFDIPQSLRDAALHKGMPLFSGGHMFVPAQYYRDEEKKR